MCCELLLANMKGGETAKSLGNALSRRVNEQRRRASGWQMSTHCQRTHGGDGTYRSFRRRARGCLFGTIITGTHDRARNARHVHEPHKPRTEHSRNDGLGPRGTDPWPRGDALEKRAGLTQRPKEGEIVGDRRKAVAVHSTLPGDAVDCRAQSGGRQPLPERVKLHCCSGRAPR